MMDFWEKRGATIVGIALIALCGFVAWLTTEEQETQRQIADEACVRDIASEACRLRTCIRVADIGYKLTPECERLLMRPGPYKNEIAKLRRRGGVAAGPPASPGASPGGDTDLTKPGGNRPSGGDDSSPGNGNGGGGNGGGGGGGGALPTLPDLPLPSVNFCIEHPNASACVSSG